MTHERAMELLNEIINWVCIAESNSEAIRQLLSMGFSADELIEDFGYSLTDVREAENESEDDDW